MEEVLKTPNTLYVSLSCSSPISLNSISMCLGMHCFRVRCWAAFPLKSLLIKRLMSFRLRKYPELFISNFFPSFCSIFCSGNSLFQILDSLDWSSNSTIIPLRFCLFAFLLYFLGNFFYFIFQSFN